MSRRRRRRKSGGNGSDAGGVAVLDAIDRDMAVRALVPAGAVELKATDRPTSVQPRFHERDGRAHGVIMTLRTTDDVVYPWGDPRREQMIQDMAYLESILAGAVSSMVQKMCGLGWTVSGGRNRARRFSDMLANAEDGAGWSNFLSKVVWDYLTRDNGSFIEPGRTSKNGPVADLYHMDSTCVRVTGGRDFPYVYTPRAGVNTRPVELGRHDVIRLVSMPSTEERRYNLGFCAASRALRAARLLVALRAYDYEKLSDMPPNGLAAITGMNDEQVRDAIAQYKDDREARGQHVFPGILWLASAAPGGREVSIQLTEFARLPDQFDRKVMHDIYLYTLALCFGVDAREFWPATTTGATKGDALVQAQKAKGKGAAELMNAIERAINFHILPDGVEFVFDYQDDEEDLRRAEIQAQIIANVRNMFAPPTPAVMEGIIDREEARRLLVEAQVLPEDFAFVAEDAITDDEPTQDKDLWKTVLGQPTAAYRWRGGGVVVEQRWHGFGSLKEVSAGDRAFKAALRRLKSMRV